MAAKDILKKFWNLEMLTFLILIATCAGIVISLQSTSNKNISGYLSVTNFLETPFVPSAQLEPGLSKYLNIDYEGVRVNPKNIEVLSFNIKNDSQRIITPHDFYSPITMTAMRGYFLSVNVIQPEDRPTLRLIATSRKTIEISPTLLNPGDSFGITVLVLRKHPAPLIGDEKDIEWSALIKGIKLAVLSNSQNKSNYLLKRFGLDVYIMHTGYAVIALFLLGVLMSMAQVLRFLMSKTQYKKNIYKSLAISARVAISWAAAESIVSIFDMPDIATVGYVSIVLYFIFIFFPSGPSIIRTIRSYQPQKQI